MMTRIYALTLIICALIITGCNSRQDTVNTKNRLTGNKYATLFNIVDSSSYKILNIYSPWQGAGNVEYKYYLADSMSVLPQDTDKSMVIRVPVKTSVCMSTTHVAMVDALGFSDNILGISGTQYVSNQLIRTKAERGEVREVGYDNNINNELIAGLNPDIVFIYGIGAESAAYISRLNSIGIKTLFICEYLEQHPLARSEWIKLFGLLYGRSSLADSLFTGIETDYLNIKGLAGRKVGEKAPIVLTGLPYRDKWFISPGNSYISTLINDAGGKYLWDNYRSETSMPMSVESVFLQASKADIWINIGGASTREDILSADSRFANLPPYVSGKMYNNNLRSTPAGGLDYFETGVLYPGKILKDLASVFHPGLFSDHTLYYYKKVE